MTRLHRGAGLISQLTNLFVFLMIFVAFLPLIIAQDRRWKRRRG